jgi:hypothetical protein
MLPGFHGEGGAHGRHGVVTAPSNVGGLHCGGTLILRVYLLSFSMLLPYGRQRALLAVPLTVDRRVQGRGQPRRNAAGPSLGKGGGWKAVTPCDSHAEAVREDGRSGSYEIVGGPTQCMCE